MYSGGGDQIPAMTYPDLSGDEYEAALPYFWSQLSPNSRQKFVELCKLEGTTSISPSSGEDAPMDGDFIMSNDSSATSSAMFNAAWSTLFDSVQDEASILTTPTNNTGYQNTLLFGPFGSASLDPPSTALISTARFLSWENLKKTDPLWEKVLRIADEHGYAAVIRQCFPGTDAISMDCLIMAGISTYETRYPQNSRNTFILDDRMRRLLTNQFSHHRAGHIHELEKFVFIREAPTDLLVPTFGFSRLTTSKPKLAEKNHQLVRYALNELLPFLSYLGTDFVKSAAQTEISSNLFSTFNGYVYLSAVRRLVKTAKFKNLWYDPKVGLEDWVRIYVALILLHIIRKSFRSNMEFLYDNYKDDIDMLRTLLAKAKQSKEFMDHDTNLNGLLAIDTT